MKNGFIAQTAKDYDMEYHEVERLKKLYPDTLYEKLEEFIKSRSEKI